MNYYDLYDEVHREILRANDNHRPYFVSLHEAASVLHEEHDEFWDEVKRDDLVRAREELIQVAAMAIKAIESIDSEFQSTVTASEAHGEQADCESAG